MNFSVDKHSEYARGYRSCHKCKFFPPSPTIAFMCFQLDQTFLFVRIALAYISVLLSSVLF